MNNNKNKVTKEISVMKKLLRTALVIFTAVFSMQTFAVEVISSRP